MFTLGHNFAPANIHAGGLRYHGAGVIVSQLLKDKLMEAVDIPQLESFDAGCLFAQTEGIIPAPESCHAIAAAVREARKCTESGEPKVILFNLSGHGLIDMAAYDQVPGGRSGELLAQLHEQIKCGTSANWSLMRERGAPPLSFRQATTTASASRQRPPLPAFPMKYGRIFCRVLFSDRKLFVPLQDERHITPAERSIPNGSPRRAEAWNNLNYNT